jgi:hypothetical protein
MPTAKALSLRCPFAPQAKSQILARRSMAAIDCLENAISAFDCGCGFFRIPNQAGSNYTSILSNMQ